MRRQAKLYVRVRDVRGLGDDRKPFFSVNGGDNDDDDNQLMCVYVTNTGAGGDCADRGRDPPAQDLGEVRWYDERTVSDEGKRTPPSFKTRHPRKRYKQSCTPHTYSSVFMSTQIDYILRNIGVSTLVMCGMVGIDLDGYGCCVCVCAWLPACLGAPYAACRVPPSHHCACLTPQTRSRTSASSRARGTQPGWGTMSSWSVTPPPRTPPRTKQRRRRPFGALAWSRRRRRS
jgi:hypothetical protein